MEAIRRCNCVRTSLANLLDMAKS